MAPRRLLEKMLQRRTMERTRAQLSDTANNKNRQHVELAVVVPTFCERNNIAPLLDRLEVALDGIGWEAIFVDDDSPDGTADFVQEIAQQNPRVRVIRRIGRRGLASACVEGVLSSSAAFFAVIDADMQHDEMLLPVMLRLVNDDALDIVVASRYLEGGSIEGWGRKRQIMSRLASRAARLVSKADLKDPMSGFFLMRRQAFDESVRNLSQQGFKILLDLFASAPRPLRFAELPYQFGRRIHGRSKLDGSAVLEYGILIADKLLGHIVPARFVLFSLVGGLGLIVHMMTLAIALYGGVTFAASQAIAVVIAMTVNFVINNFFTYYDRRLTGWRFLGGLLSFYIICSVGAVANVGAAAIVYSKQPIWWLAALAGVVVGAIWNYTVSGFYTWNRARQPDRLSAAGNIRP
jgi:dolichol-phosphate mannosyltransferase